MNHERIRIPSPDKFGTSATNAYVFFEPELTVLDPGPGWNRAYSHLQDALANHGVTITDIDMILLTHPHIDHYGLAATLQRESEAEVAVHADAVQMVVDPRGHLDREQVFLTRFLASHGLPQAEVKHVLEYRETFLEYTEPLQVDRQLTEGDRILVGSGLECIHTPGHERGSIVYHNPQETTMYTGDHVLPKFSPNPLLRTPLEGEERIHSLEQYLDSLKKLLSYDGAVAFGGHGDEITDLHARIREIIDHHTQRADQFLEYLGDGPQSAYELMQSEFSNLPTTQYFLGMSEVVSHMDLLESKGRVKLVERDNRFYYRCR